MKNARLITDSDFTILASKNILVYSAIDSDGNDVTVADDTIETSSYDLIYIREQSDILRQDARNKLADIRERYIQTAVISYNNKTFQGNREEAQEFDNYLNAFERAVTLGLRQQTDAIADWKTEDGSYLELYYNDMVSLQLQCTQVVARAFAIEKLAKTSLDVTLDEDLGNFDVETEFANAKAIVEA